MAADLPCHNSPPRNRNYSTAIRQGSTRCFTYNFLSRTTTEYFTPLLSYLQLLLQLQAELQVNGISLQLCITLTTVTCFGHWHLVLVAIFSYQTIIGCKYEFVGSVRQRSVLRSSYSSLYYRYGVVLLRCTLQLVVSATASLDLLRFAGTFYAVYLYYRGCTRCKCHIPRLHGWLLIMVNLKLL